MLFWPLFRLLSLLIPLLASTAVAAENYQAHDTIRSAAREHALAQVENLPGEVEVTAGKLDRRLRLAACEVPLSAYDSPNGLKPGRNVVGVRCDGEKPWKLYVTIHIATSERVVVAVRPIGRGHMISADDVRTEMRDTSKLRKAFFSDPEATLGLRAKRTIAAGRILEASLLERRRLIRRGSTVQILANDAGLRVAMKGKALADGARGDRIRVRNLSSGREITGEVVGSGVIRVAP